MEPLKLPKQQQQQQVEEESDGPDAVRDGCQAACVVAQRPPHSAASLLFMAGATINTRNYPKILLLHGGTAGGTQRLTAPRTIWIVPDLLPWVRIMLLASCNQHGSHSFQWRFGLPHSAAA